MDAGMMHGMDAVAVIPAAGTGRAAQQDNGHDDLI